MSTNSTLIKLKTYKIHYSLPSYDPNRERGCEEKSLVFKYHVY